LSHLSDNNPAWHLIKCDVQDGVGAALEQVVELRVARMAAVDNMVAEGHGRVRVVDLDGAYHQIDGMGAVIYLAHKFLLRLKPLVAGLEPEGDIVDISEVRTGVGDAKLGQAKGIAGHAVLLYGASVRQLFRFVTSKLHPGIRSAGVSRR